MPCDTRMRELLDPVDPESLRPLFKSVFRALQRGKALEEMVFINGTFLPGGALRVVFRTPSPTNPSWAIARAEVRLDRDPNLLDAKGGPSLMARGASKPTTGASNCPWRPRRHRSYRIFKAERELLLNRKNMDDMMTEIGFGGSGAVQVGTAARFGRMVGAAGGHGSDYGF